MAVPSQTCPLPCAEPNPEPVIVTWVPGKPLAGTALVMLAVLTVNGIELDHAPPCWTCTVSDVAPGETVAAICVSLQLTTAPGVVPSHTLPDPCVAPNPEPDIVTCTPAAPDVGERLVMLGGCIGAKFAVTVAGALMVMFWGLVVP
jgi:hypothetical protein